MFVSYALVSLLMPCSKAAAVARLWDHTQPWRTLPSLHIKAAPLLVQGLSSWLLSTTAVMANSWGTTAVMAKGCGIWRSGDRLFTFLSDHRPVFRCQCRSCFCHSSLPTSVFFFYPQANKNKAVLGCTASDLSQQANKGGVREKSVKTRETTLSNKSEEGAWHGTSKFLWWLFFEWLEEMWGISGPVRHSWYAGAWCRRAKARCGLVGPHQRYGHVQRRAAAFPAFSCVGAEELTLAPKCHLVSEGSERPAFGLVPTHSR